jgi:hypothetical protein
MFGRQLSVTVTRAPKPGMDGTIVCTHPSVEEIAEIANDQVMQVAQLVAIAYVGKKILDTACQIAVLTAQAKLL